MLTLALLCKNCIVTIEWAQEIYFVVDGQPVLNYHTESSGLALAIDISVSGVNCGSRCKRIEPIGVWRWHFTGNRRHFSLLDSNKRNHVSLNKMADNPSFVCDYKHQIFELAKYLSHSFSVWIAKLQWNSGFFSFLKKTFLRRRPFRLAEQICARVCSCTGKWQRTQCFSYLLFDPK